MHMSLRSSKTDCCVLLMQDIYDCIKAVRTPHEQPLQTTKKAVTKCEVIVHNLRYDIWCFLFWLSKYVLNDKNLNSCSTCRRETLKITLWGDIAKPFDVETLQKLTQPVLAVFTSLNLDTYNGNH